MVAFDNYFPLETLRSPFPAVDHHGTTDKVDVKVNVVGGGPNNPGRAARAPRELPARCSSSTRTSVALKAEGFLKTLAIPHRRNEKEIAASQVRQAPSSSASRSRSRC